MQHPMPTWAADGVSLLPLIEKLAASPDKNDTSARPAEHPLVFSFGAIINNQWKLVHNPGVGQSISMGVFFVLSGGGTGGMARYTLQRS